ncbi:hypothetical protein [Thermococcus gorgonarius]|uniref:Uncharacterized protein n=1 Tax=Thermococcus gorgonarius TaxID=71997 RepID=A0A2Z2MGU0_THEGO|nr:hypothetical protein [Thermococcus gorgonarius]ASJ01188.1 hypothetical protein A3K92_06675 [Thermococcus gorgonarius]
MKRRGFLLNSATLILIIPLLLLLATYEDISSQIMTAQSERSQLERTYDVVSFLNLEFQKALEISGKRAVVAAVDYVATTRNFITDDMANNTIADLILNGNSPSIRNYDLDRIMKGQTLRTWFSNLSPLLLEQGYILSGDISKADITVALLDAFTIVIKAKIPQVTVKDLSGKVVYNGQIPSNGGYIYSTVDLRGLEDPMFSAVTGGEYQRSLQACQYPYPEFGMRPVIWANGSGSSNVNYLVGRFGTDFWYSSTHIWDKNDPKNYITNLTMDGVPVKTDSLIFHNGDLGVLLFPEVSRGSNTGSTAPKASAYNIEPLMLCINEMERVGDIAGDIRYIAVPWGMSFFERLEGSDRNHDTYVQLAEKMQDEMGISYGDKHYPIGLVSFMVPTHSGQAFDEKLNKLFSVVLQRRPDENVNSVDYCFLAHYFPEKLTITQNLCNKEVYRVYGISDSPDRKNVYFFLDEQTAEYIMGTSDLLQIG